MNMNLKFVWRRVGHTIVHSVFFVDRIRKVIFVVNCIHTQLLLTVLSEKAETFYCL